MSVSTKIISSFGTPALIRRARMRLAKGKRPEYYLDFGGVRAKFTSNKCLYPLESLQVKIYGDRLELLSNKKIVSRLEVDPERYVFRNKDQIYHQGEPLRLYDGKLKSVHPEILFPEAFKPQSQLIEPLGTRFIFPTNPDAIIFQDISKGRVQMEGGKHHVEFFRSRAGFGALSLLRLSIDRDGFLRNSRGELMKYKGAKNRKFHAHQRFHLSKAFPWLKTSRKELMGFFARSGYKGLRKWIREDDYDPDEVVFKPMEFLIWNKSLQNGMRISKGLAALSLASHRIVNYPAMPRSERNRYAGNIFNFTIKFINYLDSKDQLARHMDILRNYYGEIERLAETAASPIPSHLP